MIYHVVKDLNYGILRIYAEVRKEIRKKKVRVGFQKNLVHQKITIDLQMKTRGKSYRSCKSVPHEMTPQHAQRRVNIYSFLTGYV